MQKLSLLVLLVIWLYTPLAKGDAPPTPKPPTPDAASIYVYWVPAASGQPVTLGVSLLSNEKDLGPLRSDEYTHIAVPAGMVTLRVLGRPVREGLQNPVRSARWERIGGMYVAMWKAQGV